MVVVEEEEKEEKKERERGRGKIFMDKVTQGRQSPSPILILGPKGRLCLK